jgi:hypothetical protein
LSEPFWNDASVKASPFFRLKYCQDHPSSGLGSSTNGIGVAALPSFTRLLARSW